MGKYEEALERAKQGLPMDEVFPELKESEDERIRKELLKEIEFIIPRDGETDGEGLILPSYHARIDRYKSYLEKQKEQKHKIACWKSLGECLDIPDGHHVVGWFHKGDFRLGIMCNGLFVDINGNRAEQPKEVFYIPNADEKFVYAEQKFTDWNEEDEEHLDSIIESYKELLKDYSANHGVDYIPYNTPVVVRTVLNDIKFLKSLRGQDHWKPSDEQMEALSDAYVEASTFKMGDILESLYDDLKKL